MAGGTGVPDADLLIYVTAVSTKSCSSSTLAYATACFLDQNDRPIVGSINFCLQSNAFSALQTSDQQKVVLHETMHVLGFSSYLFSFFRDETGQPRTPRCPGASGCGSSDTLNYPPLTPDGSSYVVSTSTVAQLNNIQYIVTPAVVNVARAYFACPTAIGAPLEDQGSTDTAGSHWKERMLFAEVMNGVLDPDFTFVLSEFTLALLADSGWYRVNYAAADAAPLLWGRGAGCAALGSGCASSAPFCAATKAAACAFDRSAIGPCASLGAVMDNCAIVTPYSNEHCDNRGGTSDGRVTYYCTWGQTAGASRPAWRCRARVRTRGGAEGGWG